MNRSVVAGLTLCLGLSAAARAGSQTTATGVRDGVSAYRVAHEKDILAEFSQLLSLPNVATNVADVERNAAAISDALQRRGFKTRLLAAAPGTPPAVFGELTAPGATHTIVFYAHYDGQSVSQPDWRSGPFTPTMRTGAPAAGAKDVDWRAASHIDPEWRLYARSASDDKAPIQSMLSALDALKAIGRPPTVNVKVFYEGEEEQGSPHLEAILATNARLLSGDVFVLSDGPRHQSGAMQVYFGARGTSSLELTVYGPARPMHSGHYGNWVPNPAVMLTHLLDAMRDENGRILIPGFYDDVRPRSAAEISALAALPDVETGLKKELELGRTESTERLANAISEPGLNVRGIRVGDVGAAATNVISTEARASIDFRLVPDETPAHVRDKTEHFLRAQEWYVVHDGPTATERSSHPRVVKAVWSLGYPAYLTSIDGKAANEVIASIQHALGTPVIRFPMLGGSVPMSTFASALNIPIIGVPLANYDNNQHAANENLRVQNLWDGISIYAGILTGLHW
jgi:acetylornithine deacetylase/succinyl-diaminopimelate desuccinylase-like protein